MFGLIGPNGAGKTTTMRAILGLIEPTYGEISVGGIDIRENPEEGCKLIGFMPDFPPVYDDLVCWEFLDLFAASYYVPRHKRPDVIEKHLHLVGLWEKRDAFVPDLSRGMRQRLMLAKTLIPDPQFLMLDEPASGVDPHGRADLKKIIKNLSERGRTVAGVVAHPFRDERVLHVRRHHGTRPDGGQRHGRGGQPRSHGRRGDERRNPR